MKHGAWLEMTLVIHLIAWPAMVTVVNWHCPHIHREAEKRTDFLLCASLLILDRNW